MINLFVKDVTNTKFNNTYFRLNNLDSTLEDIKELLFKRYNIKKNLILFSEKGKYIYNNYEFNQLNNTPFINIKMHIRVGMP